MNVHFIFQLSNYFLCLFCGDSSDSGPLVAEQIQSDTKDPGEVMETMLESNPVTAVTDLVPGVGGAIESAIVEPPNVDNMTN